MWALQPPLSTEVVAEEADEIPDSVIPPPPVDPLDTLANNFPEIVDTTDDREFLSHDSDDDNFSQSELAEEFLTEEEMAMNDDE